MRKNKVFLAICAILCVMLAMTACQPNGGNGLIIIGNQNGGNSHQRLTNEQLMEEINLPAIVSLITDDKVSDPPTGMEIKLDTGDSSERSIIPYSTNGEPLIEGGTVASYLVSFNGEGYTAGSLTITAGQLRVTFSSGTDGNSYEIDVVAQIVAHETDHERFSYSVDVQTTTAGTGIKGSFDGTMSVSATGEATFSGVTTVTLDITSTITINGSAVNASGAQGDGSQNNPYVFSTAEQLLSFAKAYNLGAFEAPVYVELDSDIDLEGIAWTPIGTSERSGGGLAEGENAFRGVFDGKGNTIRNMNSIATTTESENEGLGFFSAIAGSGTMVQNLNIGGNISNSASEQIGLIAGIVTDNAYVYNCTTLEGSSVEGKEAGGLFGGVVTSGIIEDCVNNADVTATGGKAGGIALAINYDQYASQNAAAGQQYIRTRFVIDNCDNYGHIKGTSYVGGITGVAGPAILDGCDNFGDVECSGAVVGGILGMPYSGTIVRNCNNDGNITSTYSPTNNTYQYGIGGIVGWIAYNNTTAYNPYYTTRVISCENTGDISAPNMIGVGGIVGMAFWSAIIDGCTTHDCVIDSQGNMIGGIVGGIQYLGDNGKPDSNYKDTREFQGVAVMNSAVKDTVIFKTENATGPNINDLIGHCVGCSLTNEAQEPLAKTYVYNCTPVSGDVENFVGATAPSINPIELPF